jgi:sugar phosphate isomerase/epimerase
MNRCKFGVKLECFGVPLRKALLLAAQAGAQGVQFDVTGELSPDKLSESGRREISYLLRSYNLKLASIFCPLRNGLDVALDQEQRILHLKKVMDLGFDLGCNVLALHGGQIPQEKEDKRLKRINKGVNKNSKDWSDDEGEDEEGNNGGRKKKNLKE